MIEFTKHYNGVDAIGNCLRDLEKMADMCALIGGNTYPQSDLVIETPRIINDYYKVAHNDQTSYFFLGFRKSGCEGSYTLNYAQNIFGDELFLVKFTLKYTDITIEVKAEI
jgi:hypothetical protein